jgi:hypothetical protein
MFGVDHSLGMGMGAGFGTSIGIGGLGSSASEGGDPRYVRESASLSEYRVDDVLGDKGGH